MKLSNIELKARGFLNSELTDGPGETGGISYLGYTLKDYIQDIAEDDKDYERLLDTNIFVINSLLIDSGIEPVSFERARYRFACMIAFYIGEESGGKLDALDVIEECLRIARSHDFDLNDEALTSGLYIIDKEKSVNAAKQYALDICKKMADVEMEDEREI